jgi:hypothetical protein
MIKEQYTFCEQWKTKQNDMNQNKDQKPCQVPFVSQGYSAKAPHAN